MANPQQSSFFQRFLLPGFAFKAVVIGGGYATGRELAEFFLPSGPWGGIAAILLAMLLWSAVCAATFLLARRYEAYDYRHFFEVLLGPAWRIFEISYLLLIVLILAVFGAAAGAVGHALLGYPPLFGTLVLMAGIAGVVAFGNRGVERLFKYVSLLLYAVYILFAILALTRFGPMISAKFATAGMGQGWFGGGLAYSGYNVISAVAILATLRHLTSDRDAVVAGLLAGPLAMIPALVFFVCMVAFYPAIMSETLPSDFMLQQLHFPAFHLLFQFMIFCALLESGAGSIHAINERLSIASVERRGVGLSARARFLIASAILVICIFVADQFGLVRLISDGYGTLTYVFLAIYVVPMLTIGLWKLRRRPSVEPALA